MNTLNTLKVNDKVKVVSVDELSRENYKGLIGTVVRVDLGENPLVKVAFLEEPSIEMFHSRFKKVAETVVEKAINRQVGGTHYKSLGVQPLELTLQNMGFLAFEGACYTKINKYMIREKDNKVEQLKKARHILDIWIEEAEKQDA